MHTYATPGTYTITATDSVSGSATEKTIQIAQPPRAPEFTLSVARPEFPASVDVAISVLDHPGEIRCVIGGSDYAYQATPAPYATSINFGYGATDPEFEVTVVDLTTQLETTHAIENGGATEPSPAPDAFIMWHPLGNAAQPFLYAMWHKSSAELDDYVVDLGDGSPPAELARGAWVAWGPYTPGYPDSIAAAINFVGPGTFRVELWRKADPRSRETIMYTVNEQPFFDIAGWENNAYRVYIKPPTHPNHNFHIAWGDGVVDTAPVWYPWEPVPDSFLTPHTYANRGPVEVIVNATYWEPARYITTPLDVQRIRPIFRAVVGAYPYVSVYLDDATSPTCLIDWGNGIQSAGQGVGTGAAITYGYGAAGTYTITVYDENDAGTWQTYTQQVVAIAEPPPPPPPPPNVSIRQQPGGTFLTKSGQVLLNEGEVWPLYIDWGDGAVETADATPYNYTGHDYGVFGTFTVSVMRPGVPESPTTVTITIVEVTA